MSGDELLASAEAQLTRREIRGLREVYDNAEWMGAARGRCCAGRWMAAMLAGEYETAWQQSDMIRRFVHDRHRFWQGEELAGASLIVRCLHGLGDAVQMLRYAPALRQLASSVVFEVPPRMLPLATSFAGVDRAITWGELAPPSPPFWDVQVEIMELPYLFRTGVHQLPIVKNYLQVRPVPLGEEELKPKVGIVWASGEWDPYRSIPASFLSSLLNFTLVDWWNLQGGGGASPLGRTCVQEPCTDGLVELAGVIAGLDLVVTVDTLAAHMAGAIGVPVWVMLQQAADWRWMVEREDSPWYPTMRLFRQPSPGDWGSVIEAVRAALVTLYG